MCKALTRTSCVFFIHVGGDCLRCAATTHCEDMARPLAGLPPGMDQHALLSGRGLTWREAMAAAKVRRGEDLTCTDLASIMHESWAPLVKGETREQPRTPQLYFCKTKTSFGGKNTKEFCMMITFSSFLGLVIPDT